MITKTLADTEIFSCRVIIFKDLQKLVSHSQQQNSYTFGVFDFFGVPVSFMFSVSVQVDL
jgi:hypothetical protein